MKSAGRYSWRAGLGLEDHEEDLVFARRRTQSLPGVGWEPPEGSVRFFEKSLQEK